MPSSHQALHVSLFKSLFQAAEGHTRCQHTALGARTKQGLSFLPNNFCSESNSGPHPLRNRLLSPALTAQPESLPHCHFPSPTPWSPGEGGTINSARCRWGRIHVLHVKGTPSPSSPNSLEIKALIILSLLFDESSVVNIWQRCKRKKSQHKQTAVSPLLLWLLLLPCWRARLWAAQVPSFPSPQLHYLSQTCWTESSWEPHTGAEGSLPLPPSSQHFPPSSANPGFCSCSSTILTWFYSKNLYIQLNKAYFYYWCWPNGTEHCWAALASLLASTEWRKIFMPGKTSFHLCNSCKNTNQVYLLKTISVQ